jgi:hypothetical protein
MDSVTPNEPEVDFLSNLFAPRGLSAKGEAHLFTLALNSITQYSQQVTFQLAFSYIIPGSNEDSK